MELPGAGPDLGRLNIILIDESDADAAKLTDAMVVAGLEVNLVRATTRAQVRAALQPGGGGAMPGIVDAVVCAYRGKGVQVWQALEMIRTAGAGAPLVVVSRGLSDEQAAECIRLGAADYILKDKLQRLPHALSQAVRHARTERAGRDVERTYARLFENIPMAVFRTIADGRVLDANPAAVAMFGFESVDAFKAMSAFDLYADPADRQALIARLEVDGFLLDVETRMRRVDGSVFWFSRSLHLVRDGEGAADMWESIGRDVTERYDALRKIRESEAYLSAVIETAPDAVVRMDEAGDITDWNHAAETIFGWTRAEAIGRRVSDTIFPPALRELHQHGLARSHPDGTSTLIGREWDNFEAVRKNGEVFPIELAATEPIPLGDSNQVVGFIRDISARRQAEDELARSDERLRSLLAGAPVAVITVDTEGNLTFAGGSVFTQLGLDPKSILGAKVTASLPGREDFATLWADALVREVQTDLEFGGHHFHVRAGPFRLTPEGEIIGLRAVAFDNTERIQADRALRESEELFRLLFEQSSVGISLAELPRDGLPMQQRWNTRMLELIGSDCSVDEISWQSIFDPDDWAMVEEKFGRLLSGEVADLRERHSITRADGKTVWIDWTAILVRDRDQQPRRFQTMAFDVTDQIAAETRLARRAAQQTVLLELSRAGLEGRETADFLATAVELVARGTESQFGTILELRPADNLLVRVATHGDIRGLTPDPIRLGTDRLVVRALKSAVPVVAVYKGAASSQAPAGWMTATEVVTSMAVVVGGPVRPFGVLGVHSNVAREFSSDDHQFLQLAATIVSVAVERKREEKQRKLLLGSLVTAQEAERKSIAEDIHDDAVQVMTAANMRLELFRMVLDEPAQVAAAQKLQETISLAIGRLRNMLFQLIPPDLDRHGLQAAFKRHLEQFEDDGGIRWVLEAELDAEPGAQVRILMFRIFQEGLANVRKHAHADLVQVSLKSVDSGVMLRIADDGRGFLEADESAAGHLGLASMRERAEIAGGWLRLTSAPGKGTEILAWVPAPREPVSEASRAAEVMAVG